MRGLPLLGVLAFLALAVPGGGSSRPVPSDPSTGLTHNCRISPNRTAVFYECDLTIQVTGSGVIYAPASEGAIACRDNCTYTFTWVSGSPPAPFALSQTPDQGWFFAGWGGDCAGVPADQDCQVTMDHSRFVTGTFYPTTSTITVTVTGAGRVTGAGIDCTAGGGDCQETVPGGQAYTLNAVSTGGAFQGWGGACKPPVASGTTCTFVPDQPTESVSAAFGQPPQCSDGQDNDGDGRVDFPADPGCESAADTSEAPDPPPPPQCSDGQDNDGDGRVDFPADPGCESAADTSEAPDPLVVIDDQFPDDPPDPPSTTDKLLVQVTGGGTVSGGPAGARASASISGKPAIRCGIKGSDCYSEVAPQTNVRLTAQATRGYRFVSWRGAGCGAGATCRLNPRETTSVEALFRPTGARATVAVSLVAPRFRVRWRESVAYGTLVVGGRVSRTARLELQLRRPRSGPQFTRRFTRVGPFTVRKAIRGQLDRGARVMPGGYIATLRGRAGRIAVPFQVRTIFVQQPPEGVVRSAKVSSSRTGRQGVRLPAGVTQAWAIFRFAAQPTIAPIRAEWFLPSGQSIGSDTKNNAPVVRTGIGLSSGIPTGRYTVLLRAGTRVVKRLSVRVGV